MDKEFLIPKDRILGDHFLLNNTPIINNNNNDSERELNKNKICLTLKPRMETIVSISISQYEK